MSDGDSMPAAGGCVLLAGRSLNDDCDSGCRCNRGDAAPCCAAVAAEPAAGADMLSGWV